MIRVMVVDDSALVRRIATDILTSDPEIQVVATAAQAEFALPKLDKERPDVITLDMEMPGMGGLEAIRRIMATQPTPIIVLSAHAQKGAELTLQALDLGAVDFVLKPSTSLSGGIAAISAELIEKVKNASKITFAGARAPAVGHPEAPSRSEPGAAARERPSQRSAAPFQREPERSPLPSMAAVHGPLPFDLIAIGTSTGGPVALKTVLQMLPGDIPVGVVVVQHMPPVFTKAFAERLDGCCAVEVKEAEHGDAIVPGRVLLAPGNWHMTVSRFGAEPRVQLNQNENVNGHRPSVDVLMHSVALEYGSKAVGVIMTGMGKDGADGLHALAKRGGHVIAQDKDSSVIFGMNREVVQAGDAHEVVPVDTIAVRIVEALRGNAPSRKAV
jgi:two-component system, chemotaxis family, protein-glutamate methylesterase/glutaminase